MKEFKGTPGQWIVEDGEYVMDEDGNCIAAFGGMRATDKDEANANLCAAAPELLEALQEMIAIVKKHAYPQPDKPSSTWGRMEAAEAVIAKALGQ
jgi:hypothetical protein